MRAWVVTVRFQGQGVLAYWGAPWIRLGLSRHFNQWHRDYGLQWDDVRKDTPTIRLLPR